jgi:hypothetical protein
MSTTRDRLAAALNAYKVYSIQRADEEIADALLPLVEALQLEAAAAALEAAADPGERFPLSWPLYLQDRAAALRAQIAGRDRIT